MENVLNIVFLSLSVLSGLSFVILLLIAGEFDDYIRPLDRKEFMIPEIYGVGFKIMKIFKFEFKSERASRLRECCAILYGERYADYYMQVMYAQKISIVYLIFALGCTVCSFAEGTDKIVLFALVLVVCVTLLVYFSTLASSKVKKRSVRFMDEFPNAVSTIALLVNSGMILREAWREVASSSDSELYLEMRKVNEEIDNGTAESDAFFNFGRRCVTPEIKKFTSLVVQGLEKGNRDLTNALENQTNELWQLKKQSILKRGELASNKLMIPLMIMFIGVLIMVMGPIMTNLGF